MYSWVLASAMTTLHASSCSRYRGALRHEDPTGRHITPLHRLHQVR